MDNIEQNVKQIISKQLHIPLEEIQNHLRFVHDMKGDSLDTVEILLEIEDQYEIEIDDELAEKVETVQMVIDLVTNTVKSK